MDRLETIAGKEDERERLDSFLSGRFQQFSRSFMQRIIGQGFVSVNGRAEKRNYRMKDGDVVRVILPPPEKAIPEPEDIPLDIVYEDKDLLVVNKPAGMVVHPAPGNYRNTLVNALLAHCDDLSVINGVYRPGIVHRIDRDTTGLLVVAKNEEAHRGLALQLKEHSITRKYIALVKGKIKEDGGTIDAPIGRHPVNRKRMAVVTKNSKRAVTHFQVKKRFPGHTLVELKLETGRTHQIRVHMAYIGHPVIGDGAYGTSGELGAEGQLLHAAVLGFIHPLRGEYVEFEAPLPEQFQSILRQLGNHYLS